MRAMAGRIVRERSHPDPGRTRARVRRPLVAAGLVVQLLLTAALIVVTTGAAAWVAALRHARGEALAGAATLVLLAGLVSPAARGRRWALVTSVLLQAALVLGILPFFARTFPHPSTFTLWVLDTTYLVNGVLAVGLGTAASAESFGWRTRAGVQDATPASAYLWAAGATACVWLGMVIAGAAVASAPSGAGSLGAADDVRVLPIARGAFEARALDVRAGRTTAIVLINRDPVAHTFDVDPLDVHVPVPPRSIAEAVVTPPSAGVLPFYCAEPGHRAAGMSGTLRAR